MINKNFGFGLLILSLGLSLLPDITLAADRLCYDQNTSRLSIQRRCRRGKVALNGNNFGTYIQGAVGPGLFDVIPAGSTVRGVFGLRINSSAMGEPWLYISLPGPARLPLPASRVIVKLTAALSSGAGSNVLDAEDSGEESQSKCTGSAAEPSAAPGYVCIYPTDVDNIDSFGLKGVQASQSVTGGSAYGFGISWVSGGSGDTYLEGVWAYTGE